jgi:uncharacterized membrane protein YfbV (UPF0208 family)
VGDDIAGGLDRENRVLQVETFGVLWPLLLVCRLCWLTWMCVVCCSLQACTCAIALLVCVRHGLQVCGERSGVQCRMPSQVVS